MSKQLSWYECARDLKQGSRVRFATSWDIYPHCIVPEGMTGTVKETGINEIWGGMLVTPDDAAIREALRDWDGDIQLGHNEGLDPGADNPETDEAWQSLSPLALLPADVDNFWDWYENVERTAPTTVVGKLATERGYHVAHTGGGCLCWERTFDNDDYLWICDEGNGLGTREDEPYLVGYYNKDGDVLADGTVPNLQAALDWCEAYAIVIRWVAVLGTGFHPDTRAASYAPTLSASEIMDYEFDMQWLFKLTPDPYAVAIAVTKVGAGNEELRKEFADWCQKQGLDANIDDVDGLIDELDYACASSEDALEIGTLTLQIRWLKAFRDRL